MFIFFSFEFAGCIAKELTNSRGRTCGVPPLIGPGHGAGHPAGGRGHLHPCYVSF